MTKSFSVVKWFSVKLSQVLKVTALQVLWKKGYLGPKEAAGQNATLPAWYWVNCFLNEFSIEFASDVISLITGMGRRNIFSEPNSNPTYFTILDN